MLKFTMNNRNLTSFWKFSWHFLKKYKLKLFIATFLSSISLYLGGNVIADGLGSFIDNLDGELIKSIIQACFVIGAWILSDIVDYIGMFISSRLFPRLEKDVRIECYDYVQKSDFSYFRNHGAGLIENYIDCAAEGVREIWVDLTSSILPSLAFILAAIVKFFFYNYKLAIITCIWIVIRSILFFFLSRMLLSSSKKYFETAHIRTNTMIDMLNNIQLNKLYNLNQHFKHKISNIHQQETSFFSGFLYKSGVVNLCTGLMGMFYFGGMFYFMMILYKAKAISMGDVSTILTLSFWLLYIVWDRSKKIVEMFENYGQANQSLVEMNKTLREVDNGQLICSDFDIEIKNLTFGYPKKKLFNNFSIKIPHGSKVAIIGSSGSGKSTLLYLLNKMLHCGKDQMFVGGVDICDLNTEFIKSKIGFISQANALLNTSIKENIHIGKLDATEEELDIAIHRAKGEFISDLNFQVGPNGGNLSGGQSQRVCIARAFLKDNVEILCADEPTSALDTITRQKVIKNILEAYDGKTILWVDHSLESAKYVDQVILFHDGNIYVGSHIFLIENYSFYRDLFMEK